MKTARFVALLLLLPFWGVASDNPHQAANACLLNFSSACDSVCLVCHTPPPTTPVSYPTPWNPGGATIDQIYADPSLAAANSPEVAEVINDLTICVDCHSGKGGPKDHPVGMEYNTLLRDLVAAPVGPKLLCAKIGGACKVGCSSCHDPHSLENNLLRVDNQGSALCIACHNK